jgi:pimeloyl-ACP methyl ester carboxylesterase
MVDTTRNTSTARLAAASHCLQLADGRRLGYVDYGDPAGQPVLLCHGLPGTRLQGHPDRSIVASLGIRMIGIDRPGYGLSDYQHGQRLLDWPDDLQALADCLGLERFAVLGLSGGGPYAAACAWKFPERITTIVLVSAMGPANDTEAMQNMPPLNRFLLASAKYGEWPLRLPAAGLVAFAQLWPDHYLSFMNSHLPAPDQAIYYRAEIQAFVKEDVAEALRQGSRGVVQDIILLARQWGFRLQDIHVPVQLWHGEQDTTVPVRIGRYIAAALPRCQSHFVGDAGHYLIIQRWRDILTHLLNGTGLTKNHSNTII